MYTLSKLLILFCLLFSYKALAQEYQPQEPLPQKGRHELYAGYGFISMPVVANAFGDLIGSIISSYGDKKTFVGPVMAGYNYFASDKIGVGIEAGYTTYTSKYSDTGALDYRNKFFVLMPHGTFYWASLEGVDFYSGAKAGVCYFRLYPYDNREEDSLYVPAFHVTAIGVRVGKKLGFYIDSGFGYDGLLNTGLSQRF